MLIQDSRSLRSLCRDLERVPFLAVDTEFMREKTYYPRLCLIQVAHGDVAAAVDPLARGIDLEPLYDLLFDERIVKVMHSASQDLEVFVCERDGVPWPVYDTQIAAMVCGFGEQPGYSNLVSALLGRAVDKGQQFTDWAARPLSERQLAYALGDVTHLVDVYEELRRRIREAGRESWIEEEMEALLDPAQYRTRPEDAWRRVRLRRPTRRALAVLRELAAWRERAAMKRNLPRAWVIKDDTLAAMAQNPPRKASDLRAVRGLPAAFARGRDAEGILDAVRRGLEVPSDRLPALPERSPRLEEGHERLVALMQALLKLRCDEHRVAAKLVATRADLEKIALSDRADVRALRGWRREVFGADALRLKHGELALTGHGPGVRVVRGRPPAKDRRGPRR